MGAIIGRKDESAELMRIYNRNQAQLVAVYGRRRVGKTYLIRELFKDKFAFYHTGVSPIELDGKNLLSAQLSAFHSSLVRYGSQEKTYPKDWMEAITPVSVKPMVWPLPMLSPLSRILSA